MKSILLAAPRFVLSKLLPIFLIGAVFISSLSILNSARASGALGETKELEVAVEKLNFWLYGSAEREGWQQFLLLSQLNNQAARGNHADLAVLQNIQSRFHSNAAGLNHPVFQDVKTALDNQIVRLAGSRQRSIPQLLVEAKFSFAAGSVEVMSQQRDQAIADIDALIRYYRATIPSRKRALLFYDLKLDTIKSYLQGLEIEIAPEVSVGKIDSMIRDVQADIDKVVKEIDAIPIVPGPEDDEESEQPNATEQGLDISSENLILNAPQIGKFSEQQLIGNGPSEDQAGKSLKELELVKKNLEAKKVVLRERRQKVLKVDLPRLRQRSKTARQLRKYELVFEKYALRKGDPYFVSAAASLKKFSRSYFHGTSGNLQEDLLGRLGDIEEDLVGIYRPDDSRAARGSLGKTLGWLDAAGQSPSLVTAIRAMYSHPNAYFSIHGNLIGDLIGQTISDRSPIRQNAFGRLVRGCTETNGNVSLQLIDDPNQIQAQLRLDANIASGAFVQQGKIQVFTNSYGTLSADRHIFIGLDGVRWTDTQVDANFQSSFAGTNSSFGLINQVAEKAFNKNQSRADDLARQQAKDQGRTRFDEQADEPLAQANKSLLRLQRKALEKSNLFPAVRAHSTQEKITVVVTQATESTLAAPNRPSDFGVNPQVGVQIHDTLLSNYLDPLFSGKTFSNEELAAKISEITGEAPPGLTGTDDEGKPVESFSIGFTRVRPIEFEFVDQKIRVVVSGRKFVQGDKEINAGMKIIMEFKVHDDNGKLKFGRAGKILFEFLDPKRTTPALIAFRRLLDENLNENPKTDDREAELPKNFIPIKQVPQLADSELAKKLRLVQFRSDSGWLYLGWNHESNLGESYGWIYDLPAIWKR